VTLVNFADVYFIQFVFSSDLECTRSTHTMQENYILQLEAHFWKMLFHRCGLQVEICSENTTTSSRVSLPTMSSGVSFVSIIWIISCRKGVSVEYLKEQAKRCQEGEARRRREERDAALTIQKQKHQTSSSRSTPLNPHRGSREDSSPLKVRQVRVKADIVSIYS